MNLSIEKYFKPDESQMVELDGGKRRLFALGEAGEKRTEMAIKQVENRPIPLEKVFRYINEFLNNIVDEPILIEKRGIIKLDQKDEDIIGHGIWIKDQFVWKPQIKKWPFTSPDRKYLTIQKQFGLATQKELVWVKFTEDGYVGVVCDSSDINYSYTNTSGRLIKSGGINKRWDTSNLFIFPITPYMTKYKSRKQIETGIGRYLAEEKKVPIIDYYSHNNFL